MAGDVTDLVAPPTGAAEHELRRKGMSWPEVAELTGHADARAARAAAEFYLQRAAMDMQAVERRAALNLELERLDALQATYWDLAMALNLESAKYVLSLIQARIKLLRLDEPDDESGALRTVVINGTSKEYVAQIKQLIEIKGAAPEEEALEGD